MNYIKNKWTKPSLRDVDPGPTHTNVPETMPVITPLVRSKSGYDYFVAFNKIYANGIVSNEIESDIAVFESESSCSEKEEDTNTRKRPPVGVNVNRQRPALFVRTMSALWDSVDQSPWKALADSDLSGDQKWHPLDPRIAL